MFATGTRRLTVAQILDRNSYKRMKTLDNAKKFWTQRWMDSANACKHGPLCRRPEACVLGRRIQNWHLLTGTMLPVWHIFFKCIEERWSKSRTVLNIIEARDKRVGGSATNAKVKAPVRVVHLDLKTGEVGGGSTTILGLAIPHGIAKKVIADLEISIAKMFPKPDPALGDVDMEIDGDFDDDIIDADAQALEIPEVIAVDDVISVKSKEDDDDDEDMLSEVQKKVVKNKTFLKKAPVVHGTLVDKKGFFRDEKLYAILSEGKAFIDNQSAAIGVDNLYDLLVKYSDGMSMPKHCFSCAEKDAYFAKKEAGEAKPVIKTIHYIGDTTVSIKGKSEEVNSYLELMWDSSGKWRKYAKSKKAIAT
jgi:hypothetical protein